MSTAPSGGSSSSMAPVPSQEDAKPLIVRVKRKPSHSPFDAFWLEINERPLKRPLLDFGNLSLSDSSGKASELRTKMVFVKHVETTNSADATSELLQSFLPTSEAATSKSKIVERRSTFKKETIQGELLSKARKMKEVSASNARFEQIWRSRNRNNMVKNDEALHEMYRIYDVVRVDGEEKPGEEEDMSLEDQKILSSYLPLLREFIPNAAVEIESDLSSHKCKQGHKDDYVYDYYVMHDQPEIRQEDDSSIFPLVKVDDDEDFYDGPDSEYETDDSNAENNPLNDYPDETSEDEEAESEESSNELEEEEEEEERERASDESSESMGMSCNDSAEDPEPLSDFEYENGYHEDGGDFGYAESDGDGDGDERR